MTNAQAYLRAHFKKAELTRALAFVIAVALLIVSAKIQIPFWPVPLTMQSAVVLMLPCLLGVRAGMLAIMTYLGLGAAGYPVFANTANAVMGLAYFTGPTGGYLLGFAAAGIMTGAIYERFKAMKTPALIGLMLAGHAVILACGVAWLAYLSGVQQAIALGLTPFVFGSVVKSALAAMCVKGLSRAK